MTDRSLIWIFKSCLIFGFLASFPGCQSKVEFDKTASNPSFSNLGGIAELYNSYRARKGHFPNEDQLKQFGSQDNKYTINRLGIENIEDLFVSKRDNQPVVLLLGKDNRLQHDGVRVIAHEATGVEGTTMVALESGSALLLTAEQFAAVSK